MKKTFDSSPGLARSLGCLLLLPLPAVFGCGLGSEEGTIKAPKRSEILSGLPRQGSLRRPQPGRPRRPTRRKRRGDGANPS